MATATTTPRPAYAGICVTPEAALSAARRGFSVKPLAESAGDRPIASPVADGSLEVLRAKAAHAPPLFSNVTKWSHLAALVEGVSFDLDRAAARWEASDCMEASARRLATVFWVWRHHGRAVYVKIVGGKVALFIPFVNPAFRNAWSEDVVFEVPRGGGEPPWRCDHSDYVAAKRDLRMRDVPNLPLAEWWCNAGTLCNWVPGKDKTAWGATYLGHYFTFFQGVAKHLPHAEFILNKRDGPCMPKDPYEAPFARMMEDPTAHRLAEPRPACFLPVLSPYTSKHFVDVPLPTVDDIEAATSQAFYPHYSAGRSASERADHFLPWAEREAVLFFRGSATGAGTTPETNPRLALLCAARALPPALAAHCDVGLTAFSGRDRCRKSVVSFLHPSLERDMGGRAAFVPQAAQAKAKFHVYAPGHSGASRMGCVLLSGACTLWMEADEGTIAPDTWLTQVVWPQLAWVDGVGDCHLPPGGGAACGLRLDSRASNLKATLCWLLAHDAEAEAMAAAAMALGTAFVQSDVMEKSIAVAIDTLLQHREVQVEADGAGVEGGESPREAEGRHVTAHAEGGRK